MTIDAMTERLTENTYANAVWKVTTMATGLLVSIVVLRYMLAATQEWTNLFTARMQMAFTLGFHIILACLGVGLLATVGLVFIAIETPPLWEGFRLRAWPMVGASVVTGLFSLWALLRQHFTAAFFGAPCTVATVIWGWGLAQYPALIPPALTLETAKSPEGVLWFMVYSVAAGSVFVVPALGYLFYLFKGQRPVQT